MANPAVLKGILEDFAEAGSDSAFVGQSAEVTSTITSTPGAIPKP